MHVPDAADNMINGAGSRVPGIMSKVIPRGGLYEYTESRRAPTSATPTETDVGRSLWGGYTCRERRGDAATREAPHGGGPQRAIRLADLFYRRPRRNDARASLWSSARRARRSDFNARIGYSGMPPLSGRPDR